MQDEISYKQKYEKLKQKYQVLQTELTKLKQFRQNWNWWASKVISALIILYLLFSFIFPAFLSKESPFKKIETPDIILVAIILLFNSGLLENLEGLTVEGTKIEAKFKRLEQEQEKQKDEIDKLQQQQLEALTSQQAEINALQKRQDFALRFIYRYLLEESEIEKLAKLAKNRETGEPFKFRYIAEAGKELRHLRALGFIKQFHYGIGIRTMERDQKERGEQDLDLTQYFQLTEAGQKYLELRKELSLDEETDL